MYWKKQLNKQFNETIFLASIPFLRNIVEYTIGENSDGYLKLTNLMHFKENTKEITLNDLKPIFKEFLKININRREPLKIYDLIFDEADIILEDESSTVELESKIVLSMAIRLIADEFMINNINFNFSFNSNQTRKLFNQFRKEHEDKQEIIEILDKVNLVTPEYLHLNSFMYEPLIDTDINDLKDIYRKIKEINNA